MVKCNRNVTKLVTLPMLSFAQQSWEPETERTGRVSVKQNYYLRPRSPWVQGSSLSDLQSRRGSKMPQSNKWHLGQSLSARRRSYARWLALQTLSFRRFDVSRTALLSFVTLRYSSRDVIARGGNQ